MLVAGLINVACVNDPNRCNQLGVELGETRQEVIDGLLDSPMEDLRIRGSMADTGMVVDSPDEVQLLLGEHRAAIVISDECCLELTDEGKHKAVDRAIDVVVAWDDAHVRYVWWRALNKWSDEGIIREGQSVKELQEALITLYTDIDGLKVVGTVPPMDWVSASEAVEHRWELDAAGKWSMLSLRWERGACIVHFEKGRVAEMNP